MLCVRAAGGARELRALGLDDGQRVALVATSSTDYLVVWMACVLAGVPVALVNPTYPGDLLAQMMDNLDPALVFTDLPDASFAGPRPTHRLTESRDWRSADPADMPGARADRFDLVLVHAHLRHHRGAEVLRADATATSCASAARSPTPWN